MTARGCPFFSAAVAPFVATHFIRQVSEMHRSARLVLCGLVFFLAFVAEVGFIASLVPREALTLERINAFLLMSMGLAFLPLLFAIALAPVLLGLLLAIAYVPAHMCWVLVSPRVQPEPSPRERMLKRMAELKKMTPERERSKHASKPGT